MGDKTAGPKERALALTWGQRDGGPGSEALGAGVVCALITWAGMIAWLWMRKHGGMGFSVFYNLPISTAFIGLCAHEGWTAWRLGFKGYLRGHGVVLVVWALGFVVLYLRLIAKSVDVSGHTTWGLIMLAQCAAYRLPGWFCALCAAVVVQVLFLKFFVLGGMSVYWGLLSGGVLGGVMWGTMKTWPAARA